MLKIQRLTCISNKSNELTDEGHRDKLKRKLTS